MSERAEWALVGSVEEGDLMKPSLCLGTSYTLVYHVCDGCHAVFVQSEVPFCFSRRRAGVSGSCCATRRRFECLFEITPNNHPNSDSKPWVNTHTPPLPLPIPNDADAGAAGARSCDDVIN